MADYPKTVIKSRFGGHARFCSTSPIRREALIFKENLEVFARRFRDVLVCLDCNEIEGVIKSRIRADKFFSFHIHEIRRAFIPRANLKHELVEEHMPFFSRMYTAHEERLVSQRKKIIEQLIESAHNEGTFWGSAIDLSQHFTDEELIVNYPAFDSGVRIAVALAKGEPALQGFEWPSSHDQKLIEMYRAAEPVAKIAKALGRTSLGVEYRIKKLGLAQPD